MSRQVTLEESDTVETAWKKIGAVNATPMYYQYIPESDRQGKIVTGWFMVTIAMGHVPVRLWLEDVHSELEPGDYRATTEYRRRLIICDEDRFIGMTQERAIFLYTMERGWPVNVDETTDSRATGNG